MPNEDIDYNLDLATGLVKPSALPNPYEFAHPVTQLNRFAGRDKELEDIRYYLRLATQIDQPVNLALIGERASGKTSLLNIIAIEAREAGLLTARINLNSGDADPINLFWKLYDSVVETVSTAGYLFKPGSDEDIVYRRIIDGLDPTADCPGFPLRFPAHYAASVVGGRQISETKLQRDLSVIHAQTRIPCVLLFDECNVLTQNRVALEMLRNVFMSCSGYLLVLTGTPSFFPLLDDVFSPIIRQFKKIPIAPFSNREETESCIIKPLQTVPLNPSDIMPSSHARYDIHSISGGRPYEIQFLCHFMFRRVQEDRAERMELTADVIDDVLRELENTISQDTTGRPIISAVRKTTESQLRALKVFGQASGHATLEQAWFLYALSRAEPTILHDDLVETLAELVSLGLLEISDDGKISVAGDESERTYIRYHAERADVGLSIYNFTYSTALGISLNEALESFDAPTVVTYSGSSSLDQVVSLLLGSESGEITEAVFQIYGKVMEAIPCGHLVLVKVTVTYDGVSAHAWLSYPGDAYMDLDRNEDYAALNEIVLINNGKLSFKEFSFDLPPEGEILERVLASSNKRLVKMLGAQHDSFASHDYFAGKREKALIEAKRAAMFPLSADGANTVGYIHLAAGEYGIADGALGHAIEQAIEDDNYKAAALAMYNRGIVQLMTGDLPGAIRLFSLAKDQQRSHPRASYTLRCLFVPMVVSGSLIVNEISRPELFATIDDVLTVLKELTDDGTVPEIQFHENLEV